MAMQASRIVDITVIGGVVILVSVAVWNQYLREKPLAETDANDSAVVQSVAPTPLRSTITPTTQSVPSTSRSRVPPPSADPGLKEPSVLGEIAAIDRLVEQRRLDEALAAADRLVDRYEAKARDFQFEAGLAFLRRGEVFEAMERYPEGLAEYERTYYLWRDGTPDTGRAWVHTYDRLTAAYLRAGRYSETLATVERALYAAEHTPQADQNSEFWYYERKVEALLALNRRAEAFATAQTWQERLPRKFAEKLNVRSTWYERLSVIYRKLNRLDLRLEALLQAEKECGAPPENGTESLEDFYRRYAIADTYQDLGQQEESAALADQLLHSTNQLTDQPERLRRLAYIFGIFNNTRRCEQALSIAREIADAHTKAGPVSPQTRRDDIERIADSLEPLGHFEEAAKLKGEIAAISLAEFGADSPQHIRDLYSLAFILFNGNQNELAIRALRECVARAERLSPPDDALLEDCLSTLGFIITQSDSPAYTEAEPLLRRALALNEKNKGPMHSSAADARSNLANAMIGLHRYDDAQKIIEDNISSLRTANTHLSDGAGWAHHLAARVHATKGQWDEAYADSARSVEIREHLHGRHDYRTRNMQRLHLKTAWNSGHREESVQCGERLLESSRATNGWTNFRDLALCATLASHHAELGNLERAAELGRLLEQACETYYNSSRPSTAAEAEREPRSADL